MKNEQQHCSSLLDFVVHAHGEGISSKKSRIKNYSIYTLPDDKSKRDPAMLEG